MGWKTIRCYKFRSIPLLIASLLANSKDEMSLPWITTPIAEQGLVAGFRLQAGVMSNAHYRCELERLCRYLFWRESRSGVSEKRLAMTTYDKVRYQLKSVLHQLQRHHPNLLILRLLAPEPAWPRTSAIGTGCVRSRIPDRQWIIAGIKSSVQHAKWILSWIFIAK